jgi:hypothetical protein
LLYRDDAFLTFAPNGVTSYTDTTGQGTSSTYDIAALDRAGNVTAKVSPNCRFALSANGWTAPSGGGGTSVYVTSSRSVCAWSTSNPYNWLSVTPANGTSSGWVSNGTGSPRSGTVTIGGKSYSVTQSSTICNYSNTTGSSPSAGGTTSGSGTANCGSSVTVSATANAGYTFANWTENGSPVSSSASHTQCEPEFGRQSYRQRQQLHRAEQFFDWHRQLHRLRHFDLRWEILRWLDHNRHWSHRFGKRYGRFLSCRCNPISSHVAARNKSRVKWPDGVERLPGGVQMLMRDEFYVSTVSKKVVRTELQLPEFCPAAVAWRRLSGQMKEYR